MKKIPFILAILLLFSFSTTAQYTVKSANILNPDLNIEYVRSNAEFWIKYAYDPTLGGFFSNVNRNGSLKDTNQKSLISQTRHGYGFTRAFMLTGDEKYLPYAKSALDFLCNYGWDKTNGGWYCFANKDGTLDLTPGFHKTSNNKKWGFQQQYALVGIIANYEATRDATIKSFMDNGINTLYTKVWDARTGFEGYYEDAAANWSTKTGKGFTSTVDAITTNAELSYLITKKTEYKTRLTDLAGIIVNRFIPTMDNASVKVLYPETFSSDWAPTYSSGGSIGHFIKTAWVLGRAYLCDTTRKEFKNAAIRILDETWTYKNGGNSVWDHVNGGPFNEINVATGVFKTNGDSKDYWTVEQGFTGPMINYYITKNPIYLQMADESLGFFMDHLVDKVDGEIFSQTDPTGLIVRNDTKGDDFKACYHSIEMGYYAYLYSNLYYLHQPASLYYKFAASASAQNIALSPIPIEDNVLRIKSVTLDGVDFTTFDAQTRTLNIAANQGGKFKVTFESIPQIPTAFKELATEQISIYPNPTTDRIQIDNTKDIKRIQMVDLAGKMMYSETNSGESSLSIDMQAYNSGIYFVVLQNKVGQKVTKKVVKL